MYVAVARPRTFSTTAWYIPWSADVTCDISMETVYIPDFSIKLVEIRPPEVIGLEFNIQVTVGAGFALS